MKSIDELIIEASLAGAIKCGSCYNWMKTKLCPKEHGVGTNKMGPSAGTVACDKFQSEAKVTGEESGE